MHRGILLVVLSALLIGLAAPASAAPAWKRRVNKLVRGKSIGVFVKDEGRVLYAHDASSRRVPASNQKLLLSMALLDRLPLSTRLETSVVGRAPVRGVVKGHIWLVGRGDPAITNGGRYNRSLPFTPTRMAVLARRLKSAGVRRVTGDVVGTTGYYRRDWWAQGWESYFPQRYIPRPTALTFDGNVRRGRHVSDPERLASAAFRKRLRKVGIRVAGGARAGTINRQPAQLELASAESAPLRALMQFMNRKSSNFFAEVLGKRLAVDRYGAPGSISKGARAIKSWAASRGVTLAAHDSSGLSYSNRVAPKAVVRLLGVAERRSWGPQLREMLPRGGQGTLEDRLRGVPLRAKTGTLNGISALSGWVRLRRTDSWAEFSIISRGMSSSTAKSLEDRIVRILSDRAR